MTMTIKQKKDHKNRQSKEPITWEIKRYGVKKSLLQKALRNQEKHKDYYKEEVDEESV